MEGHPGRRSWGCISLAAVTGLLMACAALCLAGVWLSQRGELPAAEIERLALADIQNRARPNHETVAVTSLRMKRTLLGQTSLFNKVCDSLKRVIRYNQLYLQGDSTTNWCDPFRPVWEIRLSSYWRDRPTPTMNVYMLYAVDGRLLYSEAASIP